MIAIERFYWILLSLDNLLQKSRLGLPFWMLCADGIGWTWQSFDSQASNPELGESWVRVSALHRNAAMDYLSFKQVHVNALKLFPEGFCCSCVRGRVHEHGLNRGVIAPTQIILSLTWGSSNAHTVAGQECLTNFDSYCSSTLHTPRRSSRDFWLLCDCCCCWFFVGRLGFSLELVTKEQRRELGKKCHLWILKIMLWLAKARAVSMARAVAVQQEGFSEEDVHNEVMGCLWHLCRRGRNPSRPNLWWGQQLLDIVGAE